MGDGESTVTIRTLDDTADELGIKNCALIKVDIEGQELSFLSGAMGFLEEHKPLIYGEFNAHWMERLGLNFLDVMELLGPLNYEVFTLSTDAKREKIEPRAGLQDVLLAPAK